MFIFKFFLRKYISTNPFEMMAITGFWINLDNFRDGPIRFESGAVQLCAYVE